MGNVTASNTHNGETTMTEQAELKWFDKPKDATKKPRTIISKKELWKAIREKCLDCSAGQFKEVALCQVDECSLFRFRWGRPMTDEQLQKQVEKYLKQADDENE